MFDVNETIAAMLLKSYYVGLYYTEDSQTFASIIAFKFIVSKIVHTNQEIQW